MRNVTRHRRGGFTLVEVLIVVVILGILAATVLPQFTSAGNDAKESALVQDLQTLRSQIELYKFQHNGAFPGSQNGVIFEDAMLTSTDADGTSGPIGTKPYGPFFIGQVPPNPFTGARGVRVVPDVPAAVPDDSTDDGWIYNPQTGRLKANSTGLAADGVTPLADL